MNLKKYINFYFAPIKKLKAIINKNEKNKKLFKDIKNIILILLLSFWFLILWSNRINLMPDNVVLWLQNRVSSVSFGNSFPCQFQGEKVLAENFSISDGNLLVLSDTSLNIINSSGKIIRCENHNFSNPCLKSKNIRSIIYDRGGKNFKIESISKNIYQGTSNKEIIACAISENGVYAVVERAISNLADMHIYNKKNQNKYTFSFSEYYITDVSLNKYGDECATCGISAGDGNINSGIYILSLKSEKPKWEFELKNNLITKIEYLPNGDILAIGDKYMAFINTKTKKIKNVEYGNKILKFSNLNQNGEICYCLTSSVNETEQDEIVKLNISGRKIFNIKTDESLIDTVEYGANVFALTANKIIVYNQFGKVSKSIEIKGHIKKIIPATFLNVYALKPNVIDKVKI